MRLLDFQKIKATSIDFRQLLPSHLFPVVIYPKNRFMIENRHSIFQKLTNLKHRPCDYLAQQTF
jgi:hypothetical protein